MRRIVTWAGIVTVVVLIACAAPTWSGQSLGTEQGRIGGAHRRAEIFSAKKPGDDIRTEFTLSAGLRQDDLDWRIAGNSAGDSPNIRSELTWTSVDSYQMRLSNRTTIRDYLIFKGYLAYAWIDDGRLRDSDYDGDNRTDEYARSVSRTTGDQLWDLSIGFGYPFRVGSVTVAPMIGGCVQKLTFRMTDGKQVIDSDGGASLGALNGLNSTFSSRWQGFWLGVDLEYRTQNKPNGRFPMAWGLFLACHPALNYHAEADWNLRSDLEHPKSFEQEADGSGLSIEGQWIIGIRPRWELSLAATYQQMHTRSGVHRFYYANRFTSSTRLNGVNWSSHSLLIGVVYHFF